jgi:HEAT repeat protein
MDLDGDNKIARLLADLEQADKPALRQAVDALIRFAAADPQIGIILGELLNDASRKNRWPIAYILASLSSPAQSCVGVLVDALDNQDPDIRWAVALLLARLAKTQRPILKSLIELASKGTANQRRMAIYTLRDAGSSDDESIQTLVNSLRDPDPTVRVAAVMSLKRQPGLNEAGRNELLARFSQDQDPRVRHTAAVTLAYLGISSEEFLNALTKATASNNAQLKKAATMALTILKNKRSAPSGS